MRIRSPDAGLINVVLCVSASVLSFFARGELKKHLQALAGLWCFESCFGCEGKSVATLPSNSTSLPWFYIPSKVK